MKRSLKDVLSIVALIVSIVSVSFAYLSYQQAQLANQISDEALKRTPNVSYPFVEPSWNFSSNFVKSVSILHHKSAIVKTSVVVDNAQVNHAKWVDVEDDVKPLGSVLIQETYDGTLNGGCCRVLGPYSVQGETLTVTLRCHSYLYPENCSRVVARVSVTIVLSTDSP